MRAMRDRLVVVAPMLVLTAAVAYLALTAVRAQTAAHNDERAVATFIRSDATLRSALAQQADVSAAYWQGLSVHGDTCAASCVAMKFAAFLRGFAAQREQQALKDRALAREWERIAHDLDGG